MSAGLDAAQRPGSEVVDHAIPWLDQDRDRPFFAWVHLYDPHRPYAPPEPYRSRSRRRRRAPTTARSRRPTPRSGGCSSTSRPRAAWPTPSWSSSAITASRSASTASSSTASSSTTPPCRSRSSSPGPACPRASCASRCGSWTSCRRCWRWSALHAPADVQGVSLVPLARGEAARPAGAQRDLVSALSLRLERADRASGTAVTNSSPRRAPSCTTSRPIPAKRRTCRAANPRMADALERGLRDIGRRAPARRPRRRRRARSSPKSKERLRALGYVGEQRDASRAGDRPRGDPKDKIRLYNLLKLAAQRLGGRQSRRRHQQGAAGAGRRSRGHRGLHDAREHAHEGRTRRRKRSPPTSRRSPWMPSTRERPGASRWRTGKPASWTRRRPASSACCSSTRAGAKAL